MRIKSTELTGALKNAHAPVYLISGDEPLLVQESADHVRASLHADGFIDRELFQGDRIVWEQFSAESNAMSLFGDKRLLEVRTSLAKIGDSGSAALLEFCDRLPMDSALLIITEKLDKRMLGKAWVKRIEETGIHVQIWPVTPQQLPAWLDQRLRQAGIQADRHAIEILSERVEGNLLAAKQEMDKLVLLVDPGQILDARTMSSLIADSSRYDVFTLVDRALEGHADDACRTLRGLQEEGVKPLHILGMLTREIRSLLAMRITIDEGRSLQDALSTANVWKNREPLVRRALQRCRSGTLQLMLRQARGIDQAVKGVRSADPWLELTDLVLMLCGRPAIHSQNLRVALTP